jgi:hypothetical protein
MDYSDPPRRQRPSHYPAPAPYEDRHPRAERPPWDDEPWPPTTGTYTGRFDGASTGTFSGGFNGSSTGGFNRAPSTGGFERVPATGGFPATGGYRRGPSTGAFQADTVADLRPVPARRVEPRRSGAQLLAGAVAGFLAAAVALGVANLIAAFVRPQASPIIAVGGAFIDRTPPALKNFAVEKFGENDKNMLLFGMYITVALIAIVIGILAWRRIYLGVAGIGLFGLFGAFVAYTRPESHLTDVIPSIVGGIAGTVAIVLLIRAATGMSSQSRPSYPAPGYPDRWAA